MVDSAVICPYYHSITSNILLLKWVVVVRNLFFLFNSIANYRLKSTQGSFWGWNHCPESHIPKESLRARSEENLTHNISSFLSRDIIKPILHTSYYDFRTKDYTLVTTYLLVGKEIKNSFYELYFK